MDNESIGGMVIPPGITITWMVNPPVEWFSAEKARSWKLIPTGKINMREKSPER
jgi:hypothetical protein